jgi:hypothetical protein
MSVDDQPAYEQSRGKYHTIIVSEYDSSKRLKTTESTPYATFTKQLGFDAFGTESNIPQL